MGQQLSGESYCVATMKRLASELNTTDSQVSECHVLSSSWPAGGVGSGQSSLKLQFSWREWSRVSGHLERVLPPGEQRRLLDHLLLDVTGLRAADLGALWEGVVGIDGDRGGHDEDFVDDNDIDSCSDEVFVAPAAAGGGASEDAAGTPSLSLNASGEWSVHPDWDDDSPSNPLLFRDFAKLHLQLDDVFSAFNLSLPALLAAETDEQQQQLNGCNGSGGPATAPSPQPVSVSVYGYRASWRRSGVQVAEIRTFVATFVERVTELVRALCAKLGVGFLTTGSQYHPGHNCVVVSGTADVRSLLRQSGGIELRSWVNHEAESQELADQLQRSIGRGFDGLREARQQLRELKPEQVSCRKYFPMVMYYCDTRKLVTIIYGLEPKELVQN